MKNIILFSLLLLTSVNTFAEEEKLIMFEPIVIEKSKQSEPDVQSEWFDINEKLKASYFISANKKASPTVILVHGSGGVADREFHYAYRISKLGFNAVVIDSFRPRGFWNLLNSNRPALLPPQRAEEDIPAIVEWVKRQSWHKGKIGMLGWSHGGTTILEAGHMLKEKGVSGAVVFYPQAARWHNKTTVPTEIHHGTADDWTPFWTSEQLSSPGLFYTPNPLIKLWSYEGAHHGFDHQGWHFRMLGWNEDGYKMRTVAPHPDADLAKKRTELFFKRILLDETDKK